MARIWLKGLILAGGFATRLRPLSCSKPKLLFPLVGVPLIDRMLEWLFSGNIDQVVLAVNHLSDKLQTEVASRSLEDKVLLSIEKTPLGTGGPLKLAKGILQGRDPIVVVNGDVSTDIDLLKLEEYHSESNSDVTIALFSVTDTRPFGVVTLNGEDRIVKFEEKSSTNNGPGWINAGVYVLNPNVIDLIPDGRAVSLEREIFPLLAKRSKLRGWQHRGLWHDIGKIPDYVRANMELLANPEYRRKTVGKVAGLHQIEQPSFIGHGCVIEPEARISANTILSPRVKVGRGAHVSRTIVFEDSSLGENCRIEGSVIGESSSIGNNVIIKRGSIVAGEVNVPDSTVVEAGSIILN